MMQSLHTLMQQLERSPQWQASAAFRQLLALWPQLVGAAVAQHSRPVRIHRGILDVSVSSAAWAQTLTFERYQILQKLQQRLPAIATEVRDLRFTAARWQGVTRPLPPPSAPLTEHPCWTAATPPPAAAPPPTVQAAFQRWAQQRQAQLANQSCCPQCRCPCPTQELTRWSMCAICISQRR